MASVIGRHGDGARAPGRRVFEPYAALGRRIAVGLLASLLAACGPSGGSSSGSPTATAAVDASAAASLTVPTSPDVVVSPATAPSPDATVQGRMMAWASVTPDTPVRPRGGFEHTFLASDRGAVILIRNLEVAATTLIAVSADGSDWSVEEVPSTDVPFGSSIDGATDWFQVVATADGAAPTLWASTDGRTWSVRGRLPDGIGYIGDSAANGALVLACSQAADELGSACAASADAGANWTRLPALDALLGAGSFRSIAPLGDGFMLFREPETGEGTAQVFVSPDGLDWSGGRVATIPSNAFSAATFGGRVHVIGSDGAILSSGDGRTWASTPLPTRPNGAIARLMRAGDALLALGEIQEPEGSAWLTDVFVSADGATWRSDAVPAQLRSMPDAVPMAMAVPGGVLFPGDPTMVLGRPVEAR